jgi:4-hydroxybenzoate polyprenyltransferase
MGYGDHPVLGRIRAHFTLMRPVQLVWFDIFIGLAAFAVLTQQLPEPHFLLFILCSLFTDAGACTLNDIGDIRSDRISIEWSRKGRPLCRGTASMKAARAQAVIFFALGLMLAIYLDIYLFLFALGLVIMSHQYSMGPLKMNGKPYVSQLFWVIFAFLYYGAVSAYVMHYNDVTWQGIIDGLPFLAVLVIFVGIAETLAKDLRDLDNDRDSGKITTPVRIGARIAAPASFVFSVIGISLWAVPHFIGGRTPIYFQVPIGILFVAWNAICLYLCYAIYKRYSKESSRALHKGYLLTLTGILALTFVASVF